MFQPGALLLSKKLSTHLYIAKLRRTPGYCGLRTALATDLKLVFRFALAGF